VESDSAVFRMSEGLTLETIPQPLDECLKIVEIPERDVAAQVFRSLVKFNIQDEI
jgi:hypothetical protein